MSFYEKQPASRLGRSIALTVTTATQSTTAFGSQTRQCRVATANSIWITIGSTTTDVTAASSATFIPANFPEYFCVSPGQHLNWVSATTSTGNVMSVTEMA
jgi:hypothetical protein